MKTLGFKRLGFLSCVSAGALLLACSASPDGPVTGFPAVNGGSGGSDSDVSMAGEGSEDPVANAGSTSEDPSTPVNNVDSEPDGDPVARCDASEAGPRVLRRLNRREIEATLRDVFPSLGQDWTSGLSPDTISDEGFDNDTGILTVSRQTMRELSAAADSVGQSVAQNLQQVLPCAAQQQDEACATEYLSTVGRRMFRRPLTQEEQTSFLEFFNTALTATGDFAQAMGWVTRGLVESPSFVYRRELGEVQGEVARLSQFEIASELAFAFTGKAPSDELLDRAAAGELSSPEVLVETARDLLLNEGQGVIQNFFDSYVGHARVTSVAKTNVQEFGALRPAMLEETRRFIDEVILERGQGVRELLTANFTTPSAELASFYGFGAPEQDFSVVERPEGRGLGILAQGAVLATLAQPDGSSPTKRGLWVYERLLCNVVPAVPPNIPELGEPEPGQRTTRQRYEEDHATGGCQNCHSRWDPIGFGFEHYDEVGRYRADEGGLTIDAASHVPYRGETLFTFDGQEDLVTQLAEEPLVHQCMSGYLATYTFGEGLSCAAETRRDEFIDGSIGVVDYLASLAGEPHFVERRLGAPASE